MHSSPAGPVPITIASNSATSPKHSRRAGQGNPPRRRTPGVDAPRLRQRQPLPPPPTGRGEDLPLAARLPLPRLRAALRRQARTGPAQRPRPRGPAARLKRTAERDDRRRQLGHRRCRRRQLRCSPPTTASSASTYRNRTGAPDIRGRAGRPATRAESYNHEALRREAITETEVLSAALEHGFAELSDVGLIVIETNGHLAVLSQKAAKRWMPAR